MLTGHEDRVRPLVGEWGRDWGRVGGQEQGPGSSSLESKTLPLKFLASESTASVFTLCSGLSLVSAALEHFSGGSVVKNLPANARDMGSILALESSNGKGDGNPFQYSLPGKSQRSLVGYSP